MKYGPWFRRAGMEAEPEHLLLTNGAQHALSISLSVLCGPGGFLYVEEQTYPGVISLARHLGINLVPVLMDTEGMVPDALDQALAERKDTNRAVYLTPTMQNPPTGSMGRRAPSKRSPAVFVGARALWRSRTTCYSFMR